MRRIIYMLCLWALMIVSLHSQGMQDSLFTLDAVEIKAERFFLKEEAGSKYTLVDSLVLQSKMNRTVSDVLSENTSVFIKNHGRGSLATASFRGSTASHTQTSWNGISISSPMAGMVDFSLIPVYVIDEIQLKHGPASLVDGAGGLGGSINLENTPRWDQGTAFEYMQGTGSYRTFDEYLKVGIGNSRIQSRTRLYHDYSKNNYTFINRSIGNIDPMSGEVIHPLDTNLHAGYLRYGLVQELYFRPRAGHMVSVIYWGQFADRSIPTHTSYEGPENSNLNRQTDEDHRVISSWKYYTGNGKLLLRSGYSGKQLGYSQKNQIPGLGLVPTVYSMSNQQSFLNTASYNWEPSPDLSFEGKLDLNHHEVDSRDGISSLGYLIDRKELFLIGSIRKNFLERINLNLMLRQDWVDGVRAPLLPYLGADFRLLKSTDLVLKGNISRNYRQPSLNDLYWQPGGNPELVPEEGFSMEGGFEFRKQFSAYHLKAGLTLYRTKIENWIVWIPSYKGFWEPFNIDKVHSRGLELDLLLRGTLGKLDYRFSGNYALTSSVNLSKSSFMGDDSYGKQLVYIPLHSGNLMLRLAYRSVFMVYQYNAYSERYTTSSNDPTQRDWLYPYFMNDVAMGATFRIRTLNISAEMKVSNLFDESYHTVLYRPMPGRNYHIVITFKL